MSYSPPRKARQPPSLEPIFSPAPSDESFVCETPPPSVQDILGSPGFEDIRGLLRDQREAVQAKLIDATYLRPRHAPMTFINKSYTPPPEVANRGAGGAAHNEIRLPRASTPALTTRATQDTRVAEIIERSEKIAKSFRNISTEQLLRKLVSDSQQQHQSPHQRHQQDGSSTTASMLTPRSLVSFARANQSAAFDPAPFSPPLVKLNVAQASQGTTVFKPWRGLAAVLYLDMSGYSRITTGLAARGPHVVSKAVNDYMSQLIDIVVNGYKGEIGSFGGDSLLAVFTSSEKYIAECCMTACACAVSLQKSCERYTPAEDEPLLEFKLHIGIACDYLESIVMDNPNVKNTVRATHFLTGPVVSALVPLVDAAGGGETVISQAVVDYCRRSIEILPMIDPKIKDKHFLVGAGGIPHLKGVLDCIGHYCEKETKTGEDPSSADDDDDDDVEVNMEVVLPHFVHPTITKHLSASTKLAVEECEMRFLCVLFVHKAVLPGFSIPTDDWFRVVQDVLDRNRCPIVKLVHDDKGIYAVAATNLFKAEDRPVLVGVHAAIELTSRGIGTDIGMACGSTFCGLFGSPLACRWDISGAAATRACRLMLHAKKHRVDIAGCCCDTSIFEHIGDMSMLVKAHKQAVIKGWTSTSFVDITVYCLGSSGRETSAWKITSPPSACRLCHEAEYHKLAGAVQGSSVGGMVIHGPTGIGKQTLAVRALMDSGVVAVVHSQSSQQPIAVAETIAGWYRHHTNPEIRDTARSVLEFWGAQRVTSTIEFLTKLCCLVMSQPGCRFSLVVRDAEDLDSLSLAFIRSLSSAPLFSSGAFPEDNKFLFVLCVRPSVGSHFHVDFPPSQCLLSVSLSSVPHSVAGAIADERATWRLEQHLRDLIVEKSSGVPLHLAALVTFINAQRPEMTRMSGDGTVSAVGEETLTAIRNWNWGIHMERHGGTSPPITPSLTRLLEQVPADLRVAVKVLAAVSNCDASGPFPAWVVEHVAQRHVRKKMDAVTLWATLNNIHVVRCSWDLAPPAASSLRGRRQSLSSLRASGLLMYVQFFSTAMRDVAVGECEPAQLVACAEDCLAALDSAASSEQLQLPGQSRQVHRAQLLLAQDKPQKALKELQPPLLTTTESDRNMEWLVHRLRAECERKLSLDAASHGAADRRSTAADKCQEEAADAVSSRLPTSSAGQPASTAFAEMPPDIIRVKNLLPPISLGPAAVWLCAMAWRIQCNYLDAVGGRTSEDESESCDTACKLPAKELVDRYGRIVGRIARLAGEYGPFHRTVLVKEQRHLAKLVTFKPSAVEMTQNATDFLKHLSDMCHRRGILVADMTYKWRTRAAASIQELHDQLGANGEAASDLRRRTLRSGVLTILSAERGLEHIFSAGCQELEYNMSNTERDILDAGFHRTMMVLAMGGFVPEHDKMSLEAIRGFVLQQNRETVATFAAFVYLHYELCDLLH